MRRLLRLTLLLIIIGGLAVAAFLLLNNTSDDSNTVIVNLPTQTPAPAEPTPNEPDDEEKPPITVSDECNPVAAASGVTVDAQTVRSQRPQTLPNGEPFPNTPPRLVFRSQSAMGLSSANSLSSRQVVTPVMIQFTPNSSQDERRRFLAEIGARTRREIPALNTFLVNLRPGETVANIPNSPIVANIERDQVAESTQVNIPPSDIRYGEQWALSVIGALDAWQQITPESPEVIVAVIDSGICLDHPDLAGRVVPGFDFVEYDDTPQDTFGHGCGVAGVIAASVDNNVGIAGVAPNAKIMPLRVLDASGLGGYANIALAITHAVDNGADIINLSLAGPFYSEIMEDAVNYALANDVTVIAAAGNMASDRTFYPAGFTGVIAVGSIDPSLQRSDFSNYGNYIDMQAPGRDILTTNTANDYELQSGTSFAAPQVAGIAAMAQAFGVPLNVEDDIVFLYPPESIPNCE
jgi:thermitase